MRSTAAEKRCSSDVGIADAAGCEIEADAAEAGLLHGIQIGLAGPVVNHGNAPSGRPPRFHAEQGGRIVGAVDARRHDHHALDMQRLVQRRHFLRARQFGRVDAACEERKFFGIGVDMGVAIAGPGRHVEIDRRRGLGGFARRSLVFMATPAATEASRRLRLVSMVFSLLKVECDVNSGMLKYHFKIPLKKKSRNTRKAASDFKKSNGKKIFLKKKRVRFQMRKVACRLNQKRSDLTNQPPARMIRLHLESIHAKILKEIQNRRVRFAVLVVLFGVYGFRKLQALAADPVGEKDCRPPRRRRAGQDRSGADQGDCAAAGVKWSQLGGSINDASCLNRTEIYGVVEVRSVDDIAKTLAFARDNKLSVTTAGVRHSMGGQAFRKGGIVLDMRGFNRIVLNETRDR